jgi:hypothetical protein
MDSLLDEPKGQKGNMITDVLRTQILDYSKSFKTSWVNLGQALFTVWQDKHFHAWGYEKFEHYVEREVGLNKQLAMRLLKTYYFLEQDEPAYLKEEFTEARDAKHVPGHEALNVLRLARKNKDLERSDYVQLKKDVFEKGKDVSAVRKELTAIIKERKVVDPDEERDKRNRQAIQRLLNSLKMFEKEMQTLKLIPEHLLKEAKTLSGKLETQIQ